MGQDVNTTLQIPTRGFVQATTEFAKTETSSFTKLFIYGATWIEYFKGEKFDPDSSPAKIRTTANIIRLGAAGYQGVFEKVRQAHEAAKKSWSQIEIPAWKDLTAEKAKKAASQGLDAASPAFFKALDIVSPVSDVVEITYLQGIAKIPFSVMDAVKKFNATVMIVVFGKQAYDAYQMHGAIKSDTTMSDTVKSVKLNKQLFEGAKAISYIVLGVMICLSAFFAVAIPAIAFTASATSALVFSILSYYNEKWGAPLPARVV